MKKLSYIFLFTLFWLSGCVIASADTHYVRVDGGNADECTGLADAAYDGAGGPDACAMNSPQWVFPPRGQSTARAAADGDTVILQTSGSWRIGCQNDVNCDDADVNVGSNCSLAAKYDCWMDTIPSNITLIGCSATGCADPADRPELWGAGRVQYMLRVNGTTGVTIKDIEITDRSTCLSNHPIYDCGGAESTANKFSGQDGIYIENATNLTMTNIYVHGLRRNSLSGMPGDNFVLNGSNTNIGFSSTLWNLEPANITTTAFVRTVQGTDSENHVVFEYAGCAENHTNEGNPASQGCENFTSQEGDCIGSPDNLMGGDWTFDHTTFRYCVADGIDFLYHRTGSDKVIVKNSYFEGNAGNAIKINGALDFYNNIVVGNCNYFNGKVFDYNVADCRGSGNAIAGRFDATPQQRRIIGNTFVDLEGQGGFTSSSGGYGLAACDADNDLIIENNIIQSNDSINFLGTTENCANADRSGSDNNISGLSNIPSWVINTVTGDPALSGAVTFGTVDVIPSVTSPGNNLANSNANGQPATDYNDDTRGSPADIGALEQGSSVPTATCGNSLIEGSETCDDGDTAGSDGCSATCAIESGWSCIGEPSVCTTDCGDGTIAGSETCDDSGTTAGDGCDANCNIEPGWTCTGQPSSCSQNNVCGNSIIVSPETCDDGNTTNGDGCSEDCKTENPNYVLFFNGTETDTNNRLTIDVHGVTASGLTRAESAKVEFDQGVGNIGNFTIEGHYQQNSCTDGGTATPAFSEGSTDSVDSVTSRTTSFTVNSCDNCIMTVSVYREDAGFNSTISSVTFDDVAATFHTSKSFAGNNRIDVFDLVAPNVTTANVVVTFSTTIGALAVSIDVWDGLAQQAPEVVSTSSSLDHTINTASDNSLAIQFSSSSESGSTLTTSDTSVRTFTNAGDLSAQISYQLVPNIGQTTLSSSSTSGTVSSIVLAYAPANTGGTNFGRMGIIGASATQRADLKAQETADDGFFIYSECKNAAAQTVFHLFNVQGTNTEDTCTVNNTSPNVYWLFDRSDTALTLTLYSDPARATTSTCASGNNPMTATTTSDTFQYYTFGASYNDSASGTIQSATVEDIDLTSGGAPAPPVSSGMSADGAVITGGASWP